MLSSLLILVYAVASLPGHSPILVYNIEKLGVMWGRGTCMHNLRSSKHNIEMPTCCLISPSSASRGLNDAPLPPSLPSSSALICLISRSSPSTFFSALVDCFLESDNSAFNPLISFSHLRTASAVCYIDIQ